MSVSDSVSVPRQFIADFECVSNFYQLAERGELEDARAAVKRDTQSAIVTFARLADAIRKGNT